MSCDCGRDLGGDPFAKLRLSDLQLVCRLQIEPEARTIAEITSQAHGGLWGDAPLSVQDVGDAAGAHSERQRERVCRELARLHFPSKEPAGVDGLHRQSLLND